MKRSDYLFFRYGKVLLFRTCPLHARTHLLRGYMYSSPWPAWLFSRAFPPSFRNQTRFPAAFARRVESSGSWVRRYRSDESWGSRCCRSAWSAQGKRRVPTEFILRISERTRTRKAYRGTLIAMVFIRAISSPSSSPLSPLCRLHHLDVRDALDRAQSLFRRVHHLLFDSTSDARYAFERHDVLICHDAFSDRSHVAQRGGA